MNDDAIYLRQLELGPMQNFVYLVGDPVTRECVVVDPAWEIDTLVETVEADGMRLTGALVTHTHQDHVGGSLESWGMPGRIPGIEELLERIAAKVYVHKAEREFLKGFGSDLVKVDNHDTLKIGRLTLTFMHTPGHTPGSQCFLIDGRL
ncbi:MAG: MBL fold metallo-hydrolase, partial [candidate division NC10 bacterium]